MSTESIKILQNCLKKLKEMPQEEFDKMVIEKGLGEEFEEDDSVYEDEDFTLILAQEETDPMHEEEFAINLEISLNDFSESWTNYIAERWINSSTSNNWCNSCEKSFIVKNNEKEYKPSDSKGLDIAA